MNPQALAKSSLLRILLALAVLLGLVFLTVKQADLLLGKALAGAFGANRAEYESVWFDWGGNVTARNVVLRPHDPGTAVELHFDRVWLETPGWSFFLRHALDRDLAQARFERLHLLFRDAIQTDGLAALLPEFGPVGADSGAMFEAEGCPVSRGFSRDELVDMGLSIGSTSFELDQRIEGDALHQSYVLETPGSSRAQLERNGRLDAPRVSLLDERLAARIESERWSVRDQGFVPARNRHCAAQAGIGPRDFPERHIEAIDRFMQRAGLAVDENTRAFYRRFARSGGEMAFGGSYQPPLSAEESLDERDDGRALARMSAALERDTRAVPVVWRQVPAVGAPEPDEQRKPATAPAPRIEEPVAPPAETVVTPPRVEAPVAPPTETVMATPRVEEPVALPTETVMATPRVEEPVAPPAEPVATPRVEEPAAPPAETVPVQVSVPEPAPPMHATPVESVAEPAPPPVETPVMTPPEPAPVRPSTGPRIERAPPVARRQSLAWDDLARHRGRYVRMWTVHNPPRTVELIEVSGDSARVRAKLGGGHAEYTVQRSGFIKATSIE